MGFPVVSRARRQQWIKSFLPLRVRLGTDVFTVGNAKAAQRLNQFPALCTIPRIEDDEHNHLLAMHVFWKKWQGGGLAQESPHIELFGCRSNEFAILTKHLLCLVERKNDQP